MLLPQYLAHARLEWGYAEQTLDRYHAVMRQIVRILGDLPATDLGKGHVMLIKAMVGRRAGPSQVKGYVNGLKSFLRFCGSALGLPTLDPRDIRAPRMPKRQVEFLTPEEVEQYADAIPLRARNGTLDPGWLCFRALVETLLGTGMRISEALSLTRSSVDWERGEAKIIGKGNKERTVFFTKRALAWLRVHLRHRPNHAEALFTTRGGKRLCTKAAMVRFRRFQARAGLKKRVTAHLLRHTVATTLLFNGCPIAHIKEALGHAHLQTTCTYYLGTDARMAKDALRSYLTYGDGGSGPAGGGVDSRGDGKRFAKD